MLATAGEKKVLRRATRSLLIPATAVFVACGNAWSSFERDTLNPGVRSEATPAAIGLPFERVAIPSGERVLDAFVVGAERGCGSRGAVLIFHGRGETVADWIRVQQALRARCVSSIVFDYSGHGRSTPPGTLANLNADAVAAEDWFLRAFPSSERRCLLSHSMGGGPMLFAAARSPEIDCLVLASPFSSLRAMAVRDGMPSWLSFIMSDVWNNAQAAERLRVPLLWVHSQADTTIPVELGRSVFEAATVAKSSLMLSGFDHNAIYELAPPEIWDAVAGFVRGDRSHPTGVD